MFSCQGPTLYGARVQTPSVCLLFSPNHLISCDSWFLWTPNWGSYLHFILKAF